MKEEERGREREKRRFKNFKVPIETKLYRRKERERVRGGEGREGEKREYI